LWSICFYIGNGGDIQNIHVMKTKFPCKNNIARLIKFFATDFFTPNCFEGASIEVIPVVGMPFLSARYETKKRNLFIE
jgi:hypothetical protein